MRWMTAGVVFVVAGIGSLGCGDSTENGRPGVGSTTARTTANETGGADGGAITADIGAKGLCRMLSPRELHPIIRKTIRGYDTIRIKQTATTEKLATGVRAEVCNYEDTGGYTDLDTLVLAVSVLTGDQGAIRSKIRSGQGLTQLEVSGREAYYDGDRFLEGFLDDVVLNVSPQPYYFGDSNNPDVGQENAVRIAQAILADLRGVDPASTATVTSAASPKPTAASGQPAATGGSPDAQHDFCDDTAVVAAVEIVLNGPADCTTEDKSGPVAKVTTTDWENTSAIGSFSMVVQRMTKEAFDQNGGLKYISDDRVTVAGKPCAWVNSDLYCLPGGTTLVWLLAGPASRSHVQAVAETALPQLSP